MLVIVCVIIIYFASFLFVRIRNADPLSLSRQITDFSTFMVPFNIPIYLLSKIPNTAFLDKKYFPQIDILEKNWEIIRDEALALYENGYITAHHDLPGSSFYKNNRWTSFYLKAYKCDIPSAKQLAPKTIALIEQVPGMNLALFACLNPGKKLNKHHDPFAFTLRYSLGLSTPNSLKCGIAVNGQHHVWKDGEGILFDETFSHYAYNDTDTPRIILMTDIDRPLRLKLLQKFYYYFAYFFNSLFSIDNLDINKTGIGSKLTPYYRKYCEKRSQFKQHNLLLYKILTKYIPAILIICLIIHFL